MIDRSSHTIIWVLDQDRAPEFYTGKLAPTHAWTSSLADGEPAEPAPARADPARAGPADDGPADGRACQGPRRQRERGARQRGDENCNGRKEPFPRLRVTLVQRTLAFSAFTLVDRLRLERLRRGHVVRLRCRRGGCPFKARRIRVRRRGALNIVRPLRDRRLLGGARLTIPVTARNGSRSGSRSRSAAGRRRSS